MKKIIFNLFIVTIIGVSIVGCKKKADEAATTTEEKVMVAKMDAVKYAVNTTESNITWEGFKPTGSHNGTINIENGVFKLEAGKIAGGTFLINMSSIKESEDNAKLEGHLKGPDFFDVEKFPTAGFEVTGIEIKDGKTMLTGNLTLKDVKNIISFPISVSLQGDTLTIMSEVFTIDRSKWNVKYGSKSFFDDLKDKFINDDIELKINIIATKL